MKDTATSIRRNLSMRIVTFELVILVSKLRWPLFRAKMTDYISLFLGIFLIAHATRKDCKEGIFDGLSIVYIIVSTIICGMMLYITIRNI